MTSPGDDDTEQALRRALSMAVSGVEPGTHGLDGICARIGGRPPRPWLLSVIFGVVDRVRYWTWRGHWTWQESLPSPGAYRERRSWRSIFPGRGTGQFRLVTVLGGTAVIACVMLSVQPFRHAVLQASTALNGDSDTQRVTSGTDGNRAQTVGAAVPTASGAGTVAGTGQPSAVTRSGTAAPTPTSRTKCTTTVLPAGAGGTSSGTGAWPPATPATQAPGTAAYGSATAEPYDTNSQALTCPVAHPTGSPSPVPANSPAPSATPLATPSDASSPASSALTASPAGSTPSESPTATPSTTPTGDFDSPGPPVPLSRSRSDSQRPESRRPGAPAMNRQGTRQR